MSKRHAWVQDGWAAQGQGPGTPLDHSLTLADGRGSRAVPLPARIAGPGDVSALADSLISRVVPALGVGLPEDQIPFVEFSEPDVLWRFSPRAGGAPHPWLTLIVLPDGEVTLDQHPDGTASIEVQGYHLPDPSDVERWAHADLAGDGSGRCRLLCPRVVKAGQTYCLVLVPSFEATRRAMLNLPASGSVADLAWADGSDENLRLPVLFEQKFSTIEQVDPARHLTKLEINPNAGLGWREVRVFDTLVAIPGALAGPTPPRQTDPPAAAVDALTAAEISSDGVVGIPIRGRSRAEAGTNSPTWQTELNRQPANRIAAAAGEALVRAHQETWVAHLVSGGAGTGRSHAAQHALHSHLAGRRVASPQTSQSQAWAAVLHRGVDLGPVARPDQVLGSPRALLTGAARRSVLRPSIARRAGRPPALTTTVGAGLRGPRSLRPVLPGRRPPAMPGRPVAPDGRSDAKPLADWATSALEQSRKAAAARVDPDSTPAVSPWTESLFVAQVRTDADIVIPGIDKLLPDTVSVLTAQSAFIEAFLVGADEELRREMRWRELPLDDTPLAPSFWPGERNFPREFPESRHLGEGQDARSTWLVVRSAAWTEVPDLRLDAWPKKGDDPDPAGAWVVPTPQIWLRPDTLLIRFPLSPKALAAHFLVFSEPAVGTRFVRASDREAFDAGSRRQGSAVYANTRADQPMQLWVGAWRFLPSGSG